MALNLSKDRIEIKRPVTGEIILDTDMMLPHIIQTIDRPNMVVVPDMLTTITPELFLDAQTPVLWSMQSFDSNEYSIATGDFSKVSALAWVKLSGTTSGKPLSAFSDSWVFVPGSMSFEIFHSLPDARAYIGMIAVNIIHRANSISLQISRTLACQKANFYDGSPVTNHPISVVTENGAITSIAGPGSTQASKFFGRQAYLAGTGFTLSAKINLIRTVQ